MPLKIVFMGTPDFAVASLKAILESKHQVVAVITAPDKPAGRGKELKMSAIKKFALENSCHLLQPERLKDPLFLEELNRLKPDIGVVVAFRMLPTEVWQLPSLGTFNLHASLLPNYRGAAPINHAIINGETISGVTTFFLDEQIDTGKIIFQQKVEIGPNTSASELHDELMAVGADLVVKTLDAVDNKNVEAIPQSQLLTNYTTLMPAPKIFKEHCLIDWNKPAEEVYNLIRGLSAHPTAFTFISNAEGKKFSLKIYKAHIKYFESESLECGELYSDGKTYLGFACKNGFLMLDELQLEGKKRIHVDEFLRGFRFQNQ